MLTLPQALIGTEIPLTGLKQNVARNVGIVVGLNGLRYLVGIVLQALWANKMPKLLGLVPVMP